MHRHPDYKGLNQPQQKKIQPNNNSRTKTTEALTTWIEQKRSATLTLPSAEDTNSSHIQRPI